MVFNKYFAVLVVFFTLAVTTLIYPFVLRMAKKYNIVDEPDFRKLQRVPVPVLGGLAVYCGVLVSGVLLGIVTEEPLSLWGVMGMTFMLLIGMWDDMMGLSPKFRFALEIVLVCTFMYVAGYYIDYFHGFWGIKELPQAVALPLSIIAGVGIINAVNLIDGVDGYSSGFGIMACSLFAVIFYVANSRVMACMALIVAASLVPFFFHNVFGVRSKMFIGDGGALMLGMTMTVFTFYSLSSVSKCVELYKSNVGQLALCLSILCIPVFDTLRVGIARMIRGKSPFSPDRTHLHHLFIDMGFSHIGASFSILSANLSVVVIWFLLWKAGVSIDAQLYIIIIIGFTITTGFYYFMRIQQKGGGIGEDGQPQGTRIWHMACRIGHWSHKEDSAIWKFMRKIADLRINK